MNTEIMPEIKSNVVDLLESAKTDLDQFREELGKESVNVRDRYEALKKEMQRAVAQMKEMVRDNKILAKDIAETLRQKLALLEEQLVIQSDRLTESDLVHQLTRMKAIMEDIVAYLGSLSFYDLSLGRIHDRIYRYKIKLAILKLKVQLGTMKMKDVVMDARFDLNGKVHELRQLIGHSEEGLEKRWNHVRHELSEAYEHLHKAFTSK